MYTLLRWVAAVVAVAADADADAAARVRCSDLPSIISTSSRFSPTLVACADTAYLQPNTHTHKHARTHRECRATGPSAGRGGGPRDQLPSVNIKTKCRSVAETASDSVREFGGLRRGGGGGGRGPEGRFTIVHTLDVSFTLCAKRCISAGPPASMGSVFRLICAWPSGGFNVVYSVTHTHSWARRIF